MRLATAQPEPAARSRAAHRQRGVALILSLAVTAVAAMVAASLMYSVRAQVAAASVSTRQERAWQTALAGLYRTIDLLTEAGGDPLALHDAPEYLSDYLVSDDGVDQWRFTVYAYNEQDPTRVRHGITDLAGLINVNTADAATLRALPGMTDQLVDALLDYIDADDETRAAGAEQDAYDQLPRPYVIRNGPLQTLDELLLVHGFNARIVYGEDANLNGLLDPNEDDTADTFPPDDGNGELDRGLRAWLTVTSGDADLNAAGEPRININGNGAGIETIGLPTETVDFIRRVRQSGHQFTDPSELLEMTFEVARGRQGGQGRPPRGGGGSQNERETISSGVGRDELPIVMEHLSASRSAGAERARTARVNVNTAPAAVLATIPGLDDDLAQQIAAARTTLDADSRTNIAWLYTADLLSADQFRRVAPALGAQAGCIHVQVIGYGLPSRRYRILEAVMDVSQQPARVIYLRDLTRLGLPFALEEPS